MRLESLRRQKVPIGVTLLFISIWLVAGIRRTTPSDGTVVLDSPFSFFTPRVTHPGWHFLPWGLLRLTRYPAEGATYSMRAGEDEPLITREGTGVVADATIRYRIDPERILDVHRLLGPDFESTAIARWSTDELRSAVISSTYTDISGTRTEDLRSRLARALDEKFRAAGMVLLSCDVNGVHIRDAPLTGVVRPISGMKVLLFGLDGADWNIIDPLIDSGGMPNLARLIRDGVRGRLRTITPMLSPVVWTSVATGVQPGRHGIIDFVASAGEDGDKVPVTSTLRKVKAIWNILSEQGLSVGIIGWWASYPAEKVDGFIVTDRVAYQLYAPHMVREKAGDGKVYPADLNELVDSMTREPQRVTTREVSRYIRLDPRGTELNPDQSRLIDDFKTLLASGDSYARIGVDLTKRFHPDFLAFYLEGTDTVAHLFMPYAPPPLEGTDREARRRFGRTVDRYYRHADKILGQFLEAAGPDTVVIVCSDHGFRTGENRPLTDSRIGVGQAADWHRKYGIVVLSGAPFRSNHRLQEASVLDITPTVLALFGLPVAEDMDGRPIIEAFEPAYLKKHPIRYHGTYEGAAPRRPPVVATSAATPLPTDPAGDREIKQKLQSLGYLRQDTANSHNNRGMLLLKKNRFEDAIKEFEQAIEQSEDLSIARLNIARAQLGMRRYDEAAATLNEHLKFKPRSKEAENLLGSILVEQERLEEAEAHFRKALQFEPNFTDALNGLGLLYDLQERTEEALRQFERAVEIDPDYAEPYNNIGLIRRRQGRLDDAIAAFRRAIEADASFSGSYSNLALVLETKGEFDAAEREFRNAIKWNPGNATVRSNYGGLLYMTGRMEDARRELEKAIGLDPTLASAHNNLGAVYGRIGRTADELAAYRKAVELDPDYVDALHNLGLTLLKREDPSEGERMLRRALEIDPSYAPAYENLGRAFLQRGENEAAIELLLRGGSRAPGSAIIQSLLGEVLAQSGEISQAIEALERSLAIDPEQPDLRLRLETLRPEVEP